MTPIYYKTVKADDWLVKCLSQLSLFLVLMSLVPQKKIDFVVLHKHFNSGNPKLDTQFKNMLLQIATFPPGYAQIYPISNYPYVKSTAL